MGIAMKRKIFPLILLPFTLLAAAAPLPRAVPANNPADWITTDDYPYEAMLLEQEGTTVFTLTIDEKGIPSHCSVTISSGAALLDSRTCDRVMARARFIPARTDEGEASRAEYATRILWQLPAGGDPITPTLDTHVMTLTFFAEPDGSITGCTATLNGNQPLGNGFCEAQLRGRHFIPQRDSSGKPVRQKMRMTISVEKAED
jgi:TonB family protein